MSKVKNKSAKMDYRPYSKPSFTSIYQEDIYVSHKFKEIKAKFNSKCAVTGKLILKGEKAWYDFVGKAMYSLDTFGY
jgi:hypothetical protein